MAYGTPANIYSERGEAIAAIEPMSAILGVSPYRMAMLLGMEPAHNVYRWLSGENRPSQRYCIRMMRLIQMKVMDNVNLSLVDHIEWPEGKITWKVDKWNDKSDRRVPASKRKVSRSDGPYGVPMAEFLD